MSFIILTLYKNVYKNNRQINSGGLFLFFINTPYRGEVISNLYEGHL